MSRAHRSLNPADAPAGPTDGAARERLHGSHRGGLGLPLGILLAAAVSHSLSQYGVAFSLPYVSLAGFTVVAIVAGVIAAIAPARRPHGSTC